MHTLMHPLPLLLLRGSAGSALVARLQLAPVCLTRLLVPLIRTHILRTLQLNPLPAAPHAIGSEPARAIHRRLTRLLVFGRGGGGQGHEVVVGRDLIIGRAENLSPLSPPNPTPAAHRHCRHCRREACNAMLL